MCNRLSGDDAYDQTSFNDIVRVYLSTKSSSFCCWLCKTTLDMIRQIHAMTRSMNEVRRLAHSAGMAAAPSVVFSRKSIAALEKPMSLISHEYLPDVET